MAHWDCALIRLTNLKGNLWHSHLDQHLTYTTYILCQTLLKRKCNDEKKNKNTTGDLSSEHLFHNANLVQKLA